MNSQYACGYARLAAKSSKASCALEAPLDMRPNIAKPAASPAERRLSVAEDDSAACSEPAVRREDQKQVCSCPDVLVLNSAHHLSRISITQSDGQTLTTVP